MTVDQLPSRAATRVPSHDHSGRHRQDMWPAEREVCNNYMNGRCFYGIRCRRFHPNLEVDQTSSTEKLRVGGGHPLTFVPPQVDSHRQPAEVAHIGRRNQVHRSSNEQSSHSSAPCNHSQPAQEADALCPIQVDNVERSRSVQKSDEICQKYLKGICAWGSRCHRRHVSSKEGTNSMAPALLKQSEDQKVSRATTPMQATNGTTKLPERLQKESYMRLRQGYPVPEEERAFVRGSTPSTSPVVYTTPIPEWMCRDFVRGHCSRDQCRWKHPPPEICAKYLVYRGSESEQTLRPVGTPSRPIEADITLPSLASSTSTIASSARLRTPPPNSDAPAHDDSELCELLGIRRGTSQHDSPKIPVVKLPVATSAKMELSKGKGKARASSDQRDQVAATEARQKPSSEKAEKTTTVVADETAKKGKLPQAQRSTQCPSTLQELPEELEKIKTDGNDLSQVKKEERSPENSQRRSTRRSRQERQKKSKGDNVEQPNIEHRAGNERAEGLSRPSTPAPAAIVVPTPKTEASGNARQEGKAAPNLVPQVHMPGADGIPLVPPGLGLEDKIQEGSSTHKIKPDTLTIPVLDSTRVTFGPGFEICQLVTGFESRQIFIERLPPDVTSTDLTEELKGFGEIIAVYLPERLREGATNLTARVTFSSHEEAAQAALTLNGESLFNRTVSVRLSSVKSTSLGKGTLRDGDVLLEIPVAQKIAYAGYNTAEEADKAIALANCTELEGSWVTAARHVGLPSIGLFNVRFQGLPPSLKREELTRYGRNEGVTMERLKYESLPNALKCLRKLLEGFGELLSLEIPPGPYKKGVVRGWARFAAARVADNFCRKNSGRTQGWLGDQKLYAHHIRSIAYTLPPDVFDVLEPEIRLLRLFFQESVRGVNIDAVDKRSWLAPSAPVVVKLSARDMPTLTRLKTAFEQLLRGEKLTGRDGEIIWEDFFSLHAGIAFLDVLQKNHPGTMLNRDPRRRTITLFGPADKRAMLGSAILAKVAALRSAKIYILQLPPTIIGFFMSADLLKLQQELGHENIWIDLSKRLLKVRGSEDAYKAAQLAILHVQDPRTRSTRPRSAACPVCLTEVTTPVTLNCGHSWCKACLSLYLKSAIDTKVFPLTCLGDGGRCSHRMPLRIAQELLSPDDFNALTHASFLAYVHTRPSEFHYCPTPDCTQIYRTAPREAILQCPSCLTRICPSCNGEYHENRRCQAEIDSEDQRLFEEWKASHDVKPCPGCKALIERSAGCNHMACTWCNTHICWVCLKTYEKADDVYEHMRSVHGGIGL